MIFLIHLFHHLIFYLNLLIITLLMLYDCFVHFLILGSILVSLLIGHGLTTLFHCIFCMIIDLCLVIMFLLSFASIMRARCLLWLIGFVIFLIFAIFNVLFVCFNRLTFIFHVLSLCL